MTYFFFPMNKASAVDTKARSGRLKLNQIHYSCLASAIPLMYISLIESKPSIFDFGRVHWH